MTRREAREAAFCVLFSYGYTPDKSCEELASEYIEEFDGGMDEYATAVVRGVSENREVIDALIGECAMGWSMSRISRVSMAILRLACCEMLYIPEVPVRVALNEAVELSKKYDDEKAYSFVNGVLNSVSNELLTNEK